MYGKSEVNVKDDIKMLPYVVISHIKLHKMLSKQVNVIIRRFYKCHKKILK